MKPCPFLILPLQLTHYSAQNKPKQYVDMAFYHFASTPMHTSKPQQPAIEKSDARKKLLLLETSQRPHRESAAEVWLENRQKARSDSGQRKQNNCLLFPLLLLPLKPLGHGKTASFIITS